MANLCRPFFGDYPVTSDFGDHLKRKSNAPGIDYGMPRGTFIHAAHDGEIIASEWSEAGGRILMIEHPDGTRTLYSHLKTLKRVKGETVKSGEPIALSGDTGHATGPHLHFAMWVPGSRWVNPAHNMTAA